jgi:hypothetical protein
MSENIFALLHVILFYVIMRIKIFMIYMRNNFLKYIKYVRVYDITGNKDITRAYYFFLILNKIGFSGNNIHYSKIGICRYVGDKYLRYIVYNCCLHDVDKSLIDLISKKYTCGMIEFRQSHYHTIKKIEIIDANKKVILDTTNAKNNFYHNNKYIDMNDVIKFYILQYNIRIDFCDTVCLIFSQDPRVAQEVNDDYYINITREYFDDELLEIITTQEEIKFNL